MTKIIVLFNLQDGVARQGYETWAKTTDLPLVRSLPSVAGFDVYRSLGLLGSDEAPPYSYVEIIDVKDMEQFGGDISAESMQAVANEFQTFAHNPVFMVTEAIAGE